MEQFFKMHETTLMRLKDRTKIVENYDTVVNYDEAMWRIAFFLNSQLRFTATIQNELPELLVLAWHYANKEYGCPLDPSEYESFVEALRADVYQLLIKRIEGHVGVKEWYKEKRFKNIQHPQK